MSGLNRRGPEGDGPMTGRGLGRCTNRDDAEMDIDTAADDREPIGRGMAYRRGAGWRAGMGRGGGRGRGRGRGMGLGGGRGRGCGLGLRRGYGAPSDAELAEADQSPVPLPDPADAAAVRAHLADLEAEVRALRSALADAGAEQKGARAGEPTPRASRDDRADDDTEGER